jgi:uncharacterized protein
MFGSILTIAVTLMHIYVFARAGSVPLVKRRMSRRGIVLVGVALWTVFLLGRLMGHDGTGALAAMLEMLGMTWMGVVLLTTVSLLFIDIITCFGMILGRLAPTLRGLALVVGGVLSIIALIQGHRPPLVHPYEVSLSGLPRELDGTVIIAISDLHLGSQLGRDWLAARIDQVESQRPDMVVLLGDIFEGHGAPQGDLLPVLQRIHAPLGVWAVPGNHEFRGSSDAGLSFLRRSGIKVLLNRWEQIRPGLILAGIEDLTAIHRTGRTVDPLPIALAGRPEGATILLSHTPLQAEKAEKQGVGLMLSGHTHGGQIWPFGYLVRLTYPLLAGRYEVGGMSAIVCRGTGTWGPRMRLWQPGEISRVTLHERRG